MRVLLRWAGLGFAGIVALAVLAWGVVYVLSERALRPASAVTPAGVTIPADPETIAEGRRLATVHGCFAGCHGRGAEGVVFFDAPLVARVVAPDLTAAVRQYSVPQLDAAIRHGVGVTGRGLLIMPSEAFSAMTDADLGRIIAFLRSLPPAGGPAADVSLGPLGRLGLATGKFKSAPQLVAETAPLPAAASEPAEVGRHLARTVCSHCHGNQLQGATTPDFTSPALRVVAGYTEDAFVRLLREGIGLGDRELGVMRQASLHNLSRLTDGEIASLYLYLHDLPEVPPT